MNHPFLTFLACALAGALAAQPELNAWHLNTDGATGSYWNGAALIDNGVLCDVELVQYSADNVYITASGVPRYPTGPFPDGNPSQAEDQDYLFRIPRNPAEGPTGGTETGLGHIGVFVNGVVLFNPLDAFSYNDQGIWHQNGGYFELDGFDCAGGHPAMGQYHHHMAPKPQDNSLNVLNDVCSNAPSPSLFTLDPEVHSPLLGFAFDGYPIYGPIGYANPDGTGGVTRIETSYQLRNITDRHTLPDGTVLDPTQWGPDIGAFVTPVLPPGGAAVAADLGAYAEDFEFVEGSGHLDVHNGRFAVTPEYPNGTYAYYATVDAEWNPAYPYFMMSYRGVVAEDNFAPPGPPGSGGASTSVVIGEPVETWNGASAVMEQGARTWGLYPNPATDRVEWIGDGPAVVRVFDGTGHLVEEWRTAERALDCSAWPAGLYLVGSAESGFRRLMVAD